MKATLNLGRRLGEAVDHGRGLMLSVHEAALLEQIIEQRKRRYGWHVHGAIRHRLALAQRKLRRVRLSAGEANAIYVVWTMPRPAGAA